MNTFIKNQWREREKVKIYQTNSPKRTKSAEIYLKRKVITKNIHQKYLKKRNIFRNSSKKSPKWPSDIFCPKSPQILTGFLGQTGCFRGVNSPKSSKMVVVKRKRGVVAQVRCFIEKKCSVPSQTGHKRGVVAHARWLLAGVILY